MARKNETLEQRTERLQKAALARKKAKVKKLKDKKAKEARKRANDKYYKKRLIEKQKQLEDWEANEHQLKEQFLINLEATNGNLGSAIKLVGVSRAWYRKMLVEDQDFANGVIEAYESLEDSMNHKFTTMALEGNTWAGSLMYRRITIQKAHIEYRQRLYDIQCNPVSLDKEQALKFAVKELLTAYYTLKSQGKDIQALSAMQRYVDLLKLTDVSELGEYEVLKGTKLIKIMDNLDIKPSSIETIKFEEIEDEDMKKHYRDMFPQDKLEINGDK